MQDAGRAEQRVDKTLSSRSVSTAARRRRAWMVLVQGCCQRVLLEEAPQTRSDVPITNYSVYPIYLAWHALSARKRTIAHGAVSDFTIISNICNMRSRRKNI